MTPQWSEVVFKYPQIFLSTRQWSWWNKRSGTIEKHQYEQIPLEWIILQNYSFSLICYSFLCSHIATEEYVPFIHVFRDKWCNEKKPSIITNQMLFFPQYSSDERLTIWNVNLTSCSSNSAPMLSVTVLAIWYINCHALAKMDCKIVYYTFATGGSLFKN